MVSDNMHFGIDKAVTTRRGLLALSPMVVFLVSYLGVSVLEADFYKMPVAVAMLIASVWAVAIYRSEPLSRRIDTYSRAAGSANIIYMVWVFVLAGAFSALARHIGAVDATVCYAMRYVPASMVIPGLFCAACFISLAVGTSVGTVVALTPLAVEFAQASGEASVPFFVAVVLGGAFFGDNLSFISDTTVAATRTQGCDMRDKFRANLMIVLPAAVITLVWYAVGSPDVVGAAPAGGPSAPGASPSIYSPWLLLPYLFVIVTALCGLNVTLVLSGGIIATCVVGLCVVPDMPIIDMFGFLGEGIDSMGNLIIVTLMASGLLGIIKAMGGINYLLQCLSTRISGTRGAQACIAVIVSLVNLCTANNTVAIISVGSLARDIAHRYGIAPRKAASLLDTCSCITQSLIPYGAQTLLATSLAAISPIATFQYLYYPWALAAMVLLAILLKKPQRVAAHSQSAN